MKIISVVLITLFVALHSGYSQEPNLPKVDGWETFGNLSSKAEAKEKGTKLATSDFHNKYFRILIYGEPMEPLPEEKYLLKEYNISHYMIAGCKISDGIQIGASAYNETMEKLLTEFFRKNIFEEAKQKAK